MKSRIIIAVLALCWSLQAQFVGNIVGPISAANNNWGPGTVTLTGNVTVGAGQTLTINAGTHIKGYMGLIADGGNIIVNGTVDQPVDSYQTWMVFRAAATASNLNFWIIHSAGNIALQIESGKVNFNHVNIQNAQDGAVLISGAGSVVTMDHCTIGLRSKLFTGDDAAQEGIAVSVAATAAGAPLTITNSILGYLDNLSNTGLKIAGTASATTISYTLITGAGSQYTGATTTGVITGTLPMVKDIPNLDYHLDWFSPSIDAADPADDFSQEPAPNGGRANLGFYGGTSQARETSVEMRSPNGCEMLVPGTQFEVTWGSVRHAGNKTLRYSTDAGTSWNTITEITDDQGSYTWTVPAEASDQCLFQIYHTTTAAINDASDRVFAIGTTPNLDVCGAATRCGGGADCKYFNVICYAGYRAGQAPGTGNEPTYAQVAEDLGILAPYTHGIRTYGTGTGHGSMVPGICDSLGLQLHMGIWVDYTYADAANLATINTDMALVAAHPSIKTVVVGNEFLLRVRQSHGDVNAAEAKLVSYIEHAKDLAPQGVNIVTGESWPDWMAASAELYQAVDIVLWHVHPWWEQKAPALAGAHAEFAHQQVMAKMAGYGINKQMIIGETGYPWGATTGAAVGSKQAQMTYLRDLHDYSMRVGLEYWFFEGFDEPWKAGAEGAVGDKWGVFGSDRQPYQVITDIETLIDPEEMWPSDGINSVIPFERYVGNTMVKSSDYDNISVYDMQGRLISSLTPGEYRNMEYTKDYRFQSGMFFIRLFKGNQLVASHRMLKL